MHAGTQTSLEFDRVVEVVASHALTPLGADALVRMQPLTDRRAVQTALAHTTEGVRFLAANDAGLPLEAPRDLAAILSRLAIEAHPLAAIDLRKLADFLQSLERSCQAVRTAGGGPYATTANAILSGSLDPPLLALSVATGGHTCTNLQREGRCGLGLREAHSASERGQQERTEGG